MRNIEFRLPGQGSLGGWSRFHSLLPVGPGCAELAEGWPSDSEHESQSEGGPGDMEMNMVSFCLWSECLARKNVEFTHHREK